MALDINGDIKLPPTTDFQAEFLPVIAALTEGLVSHLGAKLHSLYLYGSVAQGCAVSGISDLDVCLVLQLPLTEQERHQLTELAEDITLHYPLVSKVDFDIGEISAVLQAKNLFSWGYWLKHHCRCIYGKDLTEQFPRFKPSRAIAVAVNGDFVVVLNQYLEQLAQLTDELEQKKIQRMAARKLIRSTQILRTDADPDWPETLEDYVARLVANHPSKAAEMGYFLAQSQTPTDDAASFAVHLTTFIGWLAKTHAQYE